MEVSLVIPAHNESAYIGSCLDSVKKNAPGCFKEIVVVDNASTDATAAIVRRYPEVKLVEEPRKGTMHARQAGFEASTGEYVAYIDADCTLPVGWFEHMRSIFEQHPEASCVTGSVKYFGASRLQRLALRAQWWLFVPLVHRLSGSVLIGGNFTVRRRALETVGGFDRSYAFYGDDTNIAVRLRSQGPIILRMRHFVYTSARRYVRQGILHTNLIYALNFFWPALFRKPFSVSARDVRQ